LFIVEGVAIVVLLVVVVVVVVVVGVVVGIVVVVVVVVADLFDVFGFLIINTRKSLIEEEESE